MITSIDKKIVDCSVCTEAEEQQSQQQPKQGQTAKIVHMHEKVERPEMLFGSTYKVKTPLSEHALYVTINDIILNLDTSHELRRPFEIFIMSKSMEDFQWVVALTRIISAVFRKGGDVTFLVEELQSVFNPSGGYFKKGGKFMPSLVAEIGDVIQNHLIRIGMIPANEPDQRQQEFIRQKRAEYEAAQDQEDAGDNNFPAQAQLCPRCQMKAMVEMDNCQTCLNCGESRCG